MVALRLRTRQFLGSDPDQQSGYQNEVIRGFLPSIQEHAANRLDQNHSIRLFFQFIIHQSSLHFPAGKDSVSTVIL
jgi:hypothetical protein